MYLTEKFYVTELGIVRWRKNAVRGGNILGVDAEIGGYD